jgi:hypothetical protein
LHPPATGPVETIAVGEVSGVHWELTGYRSREGTCVDVHLASSSTGGCGPVRTRGALDVLGTGFGEDLSGYIHVHGTVSDSVSTLELRTGGETENVLLHPSPSLDSVFFVVFVPREEGGELVARKGPEVLETYEIRPGGPSFVGESASA